MTIKETILPLATAFAKAWHMNQSSRMFAAYDDEPERKALCAALDAADREYLAAPEQPTRFDIHKALTALDSIVAAQGGDNGPSIQLRGYLMDLNAQLNYLAALEKL
jgi:hypothetical protein